MKKYYVILSYFLLFFAVAGSANASTFNTGDVFAAINNGNVAHYNAAGTLIETLNIGHSGYTTGMAFDGSGNLYVTGFSSNAVAKFNNNGLLLGDVGSGYSTPESVVFDQAGNMYVGNLNNGIRKYDQSGNFLGTVISDKVDWFDLTADQSTFYYGQEGNAVKTVSNAIPGTSGSDFASGLSNAFAMRILIDGGLLVADQSNIKRFNSLGVEVQTYDSVDVDTWFALNLDPDGNSFWSGSYGDGILRKFDITTGAITQTINTEVGSSNLYGVAIFGEITQGGPGPGNPVPEPATMLLFGIGLLGLTGFTRRKK